MTTNRFHKVSRLGLAALAVLMAGALQAQATRTTYAVTIVGPGNFDQGPSLGIDAGDRVAGMCNYIENGAVETKAWTFDSLNGYNLSTFDNSRINGVSPDGMLVGTANGSLSVFDWLGSPTLVLPTLGGSFMAVNTSHQAVGYMMGRQAGAIPMAILVDRYFNVTRIGANLKQPSVAYGVNENGAAVGYVGSRPGTLRAFYWKNGLSFLPSMPGNSDVAIGLNNRTQVVGYSENEKGVVQPVQWTVSPLTARQTFLKLPAGYNGGYAQAISDKGQAVGTMWSNNRLLSRAFVTMADGTIADLNELKNPAGRLYTLVTANAINANGVIAGIARIRIGNFDNFATVAYIAKPNAAAGGQRP